jgi:signal transduction histidine kinase/ligand-binding sensor domain-containing protein
MVKPSLRSRFCIGAIIVREITCRDSRSVILFLAHQQFPTTLYPVSVNTKQLTFRVAAVLLVCLAFCGPCLADKLPVRIYTSADGLGSGFVDCVMRDSRGFMWFCTRDGLSRFDGSQFVTYRVGDKNSPPGVESMYETLDGTYWVITSGGTFRFKGDALSRPEKTSDGKPFLNAEFLSSRRGAVWGDRQGRLWYGGGMFAQVVEHDGKVSYTEVPLNFPKVAGEGPLGVFQMEEAADDSKWIQTNKGVVRYLPDGRTIIYSHLSTNRQGSITMTIQKNGNVWVAWGNEIFVIKPEPIESLPGFDKVDVRQLTPTSVVQIVPGKPIRLPETPGEIVCLKRDSIVAWTMRMNQTSDGNVWIVSSDELLEFDGQSFKSSTISQGLPSGMAEMGEDTAGNIWIGGRGGLIRLDRKGLTTFGPGDGLNSLSTFAVNESRDGTFYVANGDFYLSVWNGKQFITERPNLDSNSRPLWTSRYAFLSSAKEWWILTATKLYRFAAGNLRTPIQTYTTENGLKDNQMFQIFEDSSGNIWLSNQPSRVEDRGLYVLRRGEKDFYRFSAKENYPGGKSAMEFAEDARGNLWFGFYEGGVARYRNGQFQLFTTKDGLPGNLITSLLIDKKGRLWLGSALGGLRRIDDLNADQPKFIPFTTENGLSSNNIRTLTDDSFGNIYTGTARGVDKISIDTEKVKHFSIHDGLASDFVVDSHRDRNGFVWFATTGGLSRLSPQVDEPSPRPSVWLGGLTIAGEDQPVGELGSVEVHQGDLVHTRNNFQIEFFGLSFRPGETLKYQYMLEGADRDWSAPTELRTVSYSNLRPGSYRFLVRAVNANGLISEKPAFVSFRILSPIWLRWWFIVAALLLAVALAYLVYRYRLARLREVNAALTEAKLAEEKLRKAQEERLLELEQVRKRIATDLHDDIGSSLTRISLLSEVTQLQGRAVETSSGGSLSVIAGLSRELVDSMSDIVWAINPEKDSLGDLIQRMRHFASDVFSARNIDFHFRFPDTEKDLKVSATFRRELLLIFKEAVNNTVRHSGCTEAEIEFKMDHQGVLLRLTDNGRGFDVASKSQGHGLMSMRSRIETFSGKFDVESRQDSGTTLTFTIPMNGFVQHG